MENERKLLGKMKNINWECPEPGDIRLSFGENHIKIPEIVKEAIIQELDNINLYPDPSYTMILTRLAKYTGISKDSIIVSNGIDEMLDIIAKTFIDDGDEIVIPTPTFPSYRCVSELMGAIVKSIILDKTFLLDVNQLIEVITDKTKLIFIANPNNPTGNLLLNEKQVQEILEVFNGILIIDECYYGICKKSYINLISKYNNLLILRSFSKSLGLAGLRIGYAVGGKDIINSMNKVVNNYSPFRLDRLAQAGSKILDFPEEIERITQNLIERRMIFYENLRDIPGIYPNNTETSFLIVKISNTKISSESLIKHMANKHILIRDCNIYENMPLGYVLIGIPAENDIPYVTKSIQEVFI